MLRRLQVKRKYCPRCDGIHWHASKDGLNFYCIMCAGEVVGKLGEDTYIFYRRKAAPEGS